MGMRNRERRKAKQRARAQQRPAPPGNDQPPDPLGLRIGAARATATAEALLLDTLRAFDRGDSEIFEHGLRRLAEGTTGPLARPLVNRSVLALLVAEMSHAWPRGWQPADLARVLDRTFGAAHSGMAMDAIAAQLREYAPATVDDRWWAQIRSAGGTVWWNRDDQYLDGYADRHRLHRAAAIRQAIEVVHTIGTLPAEPILGPLPGTVRPGTARRGPQPTPGLDREVDERMLGRVRALLAKAESTQFPAEAEALSAKAQELMARYSIDQALLAARTGNDDRPDGIRVGIDNPYETGKALLLQHVAEANRCRSTWSKTLGFSTVVGFRADLDAVEILYTSLLVQATTAMLREGSQQDRHGRSTTRSFRLSFLNAYAVRIGQRLQGATDEVSREATDAARQHARTGSGGQDLVPVLAARAEAVDERMEELFPSMRRGEVRVSNQHGWASGTAAADRAALHDRRAVPEGT